MTVDSIAFPNLGIIFHNVGRGIYIGTFELAFYGMVIALGMVLAVFFISWNAKKNPLIAKNIYTITFVTIIMGIIGARIYYVIFSWKLYADDPLSVFNLRSGGLGIYGGIIAGVITVFVFSRVKKIHFLALLDVMMPGVLIGQIFGRWGNYFNREAFGDYSNGPLAMAIPVEAVRSTSDITDLMRENILTIDGVRCITVHPTFLYECLWNIGVFVFLFILGRRPHREGTIMAFYFLLYGIGRFWIESLRTDQLLIPGTRVPISMVVSLVCIGIAAAILIKNLVERSKEKKPPDALEIKEAVAQEKAEIQDKTEKTE